MIVAGDTDVKIGSDNTFAGYGLNVVVENRLSNSNYTGYSTTAWYLVADPMMYDTIEVGFVNGKQRPVVERFDEGADYYAMTWRICLDVGVKALDWRGMIKADGA